jgi:hypothetical protein
MIMITVTVWAKTARPTLGADLPVINRYTVTVPSQAGSRARATPRGLGASLSLRSECVMLVPARVPASVSVGTSRLGEIPAENLSYGVKAAVTVVCFRGGKAPGRPTRRNLGTASPSRLVPTQTDASTRAGTTMTECLRLPVLVSRAAAANLNICRWLFTAASLNQSLNWSCTSLYYQSLTRSTRTCTLPCTQ